MFLPDYSTSVLDLSLDDLDGYLLCFCLMWSNALTMHERNDLKMIMMCYEGIVFSFQRYDLML